MKKLYLKWLIISFFSLSFFFIFCSNNKNSEKPFQVVKNPNKEKPETVSVADSVEVKVGQSFLIKYEGKLKDCSDCVFEWKMGDTVLSTSPYVNLLFCSEGGKEIDFSVISSSEDKKLETRKLKISVVKSEVQRSQEVQSAVDIYKNDIIIIGAEYAQTQQNIDKVLKSVIALEKYVYGENACDVEVVYALTLGKVIYILSQLNQLITDLFLGKLTPTDIRLLVDGAVKPAQRVLEGVINSGSIPPDFSFRVKRVFVYVIKDYLETEQVENVSVDLSGEHDITDLYFLTSLVEFVSGVFDVLLAYNGSLEFILSLPEQVITRVSSGERVSIFNSVSYIFIEQLMSNPAFLSLSSEAGERLKSAQSSIYNGLINLQRMLDSLRAETDDQSDDIIRYWDCGKDNICPGDPAEPFADINGNGKYDNGEPYLDLNRNGKWNDAWTSPDEGEGNNRYDIGEMIGTEKVQLFNSNGIKLAFSGNIGQTVYTILFERKLFQILADNVKGGILDIGKIVGSTNEALRDLLCSQGISFPEVRLWEFFINPTPLRDMLPLWDPNTKSIIVQRDTEPFKDTGYDGKFSWEYDSFHPFSNSDPDKDDFNPSSNNQDGFDTNDNGKCANAEAYKAYSEYEQGITPSSPRDCKNFVNSTVEDNDFGTEGNMLFDWKDKNGNKIPDKGDITEPWDDDYGILNGKRGTGGSNVIGNNKFDVMDVEHYWPDGKVDPANSIGPGGIICETGLYSGDRDDVIDLIYLLLPDPTFSGVIRLYKGKGGVVKNKKGEVLTDNALLFRTIWKGVALTGLIENYPYR
ncbi:hypothetical protein HRbin19_00089 [bacterium HR19]|nr:hypothetical protein HRbin19_00089 [bacterium HR19]